MSLNRFIFLPALAAAVAVLAACAGDGAESRREEAGVAAGLAEPFAGRAGPLPQVGC
ncbi:MAG: hypothetical protein JXQ83_02655 [Candidatus Glassbacteria bacterium]|nr:hypothetical protein [Candidatus Glassbacteria bacterium]